MNTLKASNARTIHLRTKLSSHSDSALQDECKLECFLEKQFFAIFGVMHRWTFAKIGILTNLFEVRKAKELSYLVWSVIFARKCLVLSRSPIGNRKSAWGFCYSCRDRPVNNRDLSPSAVEQMSGTGECAKIENEPGDQLEKNAYYFSAESSKKTIFCSISHVRRPFGGPQKEPQKDHHSEARVEKYVRLLGAG